MVFKFLTTLLWLCVFSNEPAIADLKPALEVYVRDGCIYCARAEDWLVGWQKSHPTVDVQIKNISHNKKNFVDY